jgi:hypothetical protein
VTAVHTRFEVAVPGVLSTSANGSEEDAEGLQGNRSQTCVMEGQEASSMEVSDRRTILIA